MRSFSKYWFPPLYGVLIYATIRLLNDTLEESKFWERSWTLTFVEIVLCGLMGYFFYFLLCRMFRYFDRTLTDGVIYKTILRELVWVVLITEVLMNGLMTPFTALTDDGLSWGDLAIINVVPLLYNLIWYAVMRSNRLLKVYIANKLQLEKITNDHLQTELKFLKAQYHPHFLFNALNTVYFQMDEDVTAAKRSIEKFSGLLRYQLYDQQQQVPVSQEIAYLQNFIELQQVRTSEKLQLTVSFDKALTHQPVYPLLLLPLVENAFKYVGGAYFIDITARLQDGWLQFEVRNAIPAHMPVRESGGIGLENLRRRLQLLYPGNSSLEAVKEENSFRAALYIKFDEA